MRKGLLTAIVVALVLALAVPAALALTDNQKTELQELYRQQHELKLQILEKQVEAGLIPAEEAEAFRERIEQRWELHRERMAEGDYSFGFGRRGGRGKFGGGRGGCGNYGYKNGSPEL